MKICTLALGEQVLASSKRRNGKKLCAIFLMILPLSRPVLDAWEVLKEECLSSPSCTTIPPASSRRTYTTGA
ncbi:hypothetical protein P692DRAFT_20233705 [Suillus brevipes Sb2]|nr:hypothetical protein P692DRAFT_20233705 [Suillus brevipes Sb2]